MTNKKSFVSRAVEAFAAARERKARQFLQQRGFEAIGNESKPTDL